MNRTSRVRITATAGARTVIAAAVIASVGVACSSNDAGPETTLQPPIPIVGTLTGGQGADSRPEASSDLGIAPGWLGGYVEYEFEVAGDLGPLPTNDTALHWPIGASVSVDVVTKLAQRLGVAGTPTVGSDGVLYSVGPTDGSAASLTVYDDALLSWNMSGPWDAWPAGSANGRDEVFGSLYSAGGSLAQPIPTGPYPLIDLDTSIERLEMLWGGDAWAMPAIDEPAPVDPPVVDPEPTIERITLIAVEPATWTVWAEDGSIWQVPAYRFSDASGMRYDVPAITAEFLEFSQRPGVIEPDPGTVDGQMIDIDDAEVLVGLTLAEAEAVAADRGWEVRVVSLDGEDLLATTDFVTNRLNLEVTGGMVVAIVSVG